MKKKFIVALATSLIIANAAPVAFADTGSNSNNSEKSATNDDNRKFNKLTDAQKLAFEAARDAWKDKYEVIREAFKTAKENAKEAFETARELATTDEARKAAAVAFFDRNEHRHKNSIRCPQGSRSKAGKTRVDCRTDCNNCQVPLGDDCL